MGTKLGGDYANGKGNGSGVNKMRGSMTAAAVMVLLPG